MDFFDEIDLHSKWISWYNLMAPFLHWTVAHNWYIQSNEQELYELSDNLDIFKEDPFTMNLIPALDIPKEDFNILKWWIDLQNFSNFKLIHLGLPSSLMHSKLWFQESLFQWQIPFPLNELSIETMHDWHSIDLGKCPWWETAIFTGYYLPDNQLSKNIEFWLLVEDGELHSWGLVRSGYVVTWIYKSDYKKESLDFIKWKNFRIFSQTLTFDMYEWWDWKKVNTGMRAIYLNSKEPITFPLGPIHNVD